MRDHTVTIVDTRQVAAATAYQDRGPYFLPSASWYRYAG